MIFCYKTLNEKLNKKSPKGLLRYYANKTMLTNTGGYTDSNKLKKNATSNRK